MALRARTPRCGTTSLEGRAHVERKRRSVIPNRGVSGIRSRQVYRDGGCGTARSEGEPMAVGDGVCERRDDAGRPHPACFADLPLSRARSTPVPQRNWISPSTGDRGRSNHADQERARPLRSQLRRVRVYAVGQRSRPRRLRAPFPGGCGRKGQSRPRQIPQIWITKPPRGGSSTSRRLRRKPSTPGTPLLPNSIQRLNPRAPRTSRHIRHGAPSLGS